MRLPEEREGRRLEIMRTSAAAACLAMCLAPAAGTEARPLRPETDQGCRADAKTANLNLKFKDINGVVFDVSEHGWG